MKIELDHLQGRWAQLSFAENGLFNPPDTHGASNAVMTIAGQTFHVAVPGHAPLIYGTFTLDPEQTPKHIDWIDSIGDDAGKIIPAIYTLAGDQFKFAAADPGMPRPNTFDGGQRITIRAFSRIVTP